jgi:hypothetical protein
MKYLIDIDWVINHLKGEKRVVRKLEELAPEGMAMSVISLAEIYEGVYYSRDPAKSQQLFTEFELYLLEHPEVDEKIPDNAMIVLVPEYDKELSEKNIELAEVNKEPRQTIVYVRVEKLRTSRIEGLTLQVA